METGVIGSAAILAGGLGTRLRSIVSDRPKVLAEIGGRPFIEYLLNQLANLGLRSVVLCTGHGAEMVEQRLASYRSLALHYSCEPAPLGTGGALRNALPMLKDGPVLVMNGDSYCDAPLADFARWHVAGNHAASLLLADVDDARRYGRVVVDDRQRITAFMEKSEVPGPGQANAGIYLLERHVIAAIPSDRAVSIEREVFPGLIDDGLHGYATSARLWDIGVPEAYLHANASFVASLSP